MYNVTQEQQEHNLKISDQPSSKAMWRTTGYTSNSPVKMNMSIRGPQKDFLPTKLTSCVYTVFYLLPILVIELMHVSITV